jgi:hypothetical protein
MSRCPMVLVEPDGFEHHCARTRHRVTEDSRTWHRGDVYAMRRHADQSRVPAIVRWGNPEPDPDSSE